MEEKKQKMIERILKLLELGKDDNGAFTPEREAANNMAAKLMAEHAIDFTDLKSGKKDFHFENQKIDPLDEVYCAWEAELAGYIARAFDCKTVHSRVPVWVINFLGAKTDLEIVIFFYRHLRRTVGRKSELHDKRIRAQQAYAHGMVRIIGERLTELYKKREEVMTSDCRDLVVVKNDGLVDFMKSQFPSLHSIKGPVIRDSASYSAGAEAGRSVNLSRPISGGNGPGEMRRVRGH